jgi:hypothetical protein
MPRARLSRHEEKPMSSDAQACVDDDHRSSFNPPSPDDPLFTEWFASPTARRPASSRPAARRDAELAPLGDSLADGWVV